MRAPILALTLLFAAPAWADEATELDLDGDSYSLDDGDCDDTRAWVHPSAEEACDGLDTDCDGEVPTVGVESERDEDGDGWRVCAGDCDDAAAAVHPSAPEGCDGVDTDCTGVAARTERDLDGDGFSPCEGDCDDRDPQRVPDPGDDCEEPGDEDCDGVIDENCGEDGDDDDDTPTAGCTGRGCGWSFRPEASTARADPRTPLVASAALWITIGRRRRIGSP